MDASIAGKTRPVKGSSSPSEVAAWSTLTLKSNLPNQNGPAIPQLAAKLESNSLQIQKAKTNRRFSSVTHSFHYIFVVSRGHLSIDCVVMCLVVVHASVG